MLSTSRILLGWRVLNWPSCHKACLSEETPDPPMADSCPLDAALFRGTLLLALCHSAQAPREGMPMPREVTHKHRRFGPFQPQEMSPPLPTPPADEGVAWGAALHRKEPGGSRKMVALTQPVESAPSGGREG